MGKRQVDKKVQHSKIQEEENSFYCRGVSARSGMRRGLCLCAAGQKAEQYTDPTA